MIRKEKGKEDPQRSGGADSHYVLVLPQVLEEKN
jgi:hypothetical protein